MGRDSTGDEIHTAVAGEPRFRPFYEAWADWIGERLGVSVFGKLIASLIPGLVFFVIHFLATLGVPAKGAVAWFHAWSWMVGLMIICCLLFLYYATHVFTDLFPRIDVWQSPDKKQLYLARLNRTLSDRNFVIAGSFFGGLNMLMGLAFGVQYTVIASQISVFIGFFLVGFVCGMAAWGIYGVLVTIGIIVRKGLLRPDFTAPGRCGGTHFLGEAFVKFSAITLMMGVLISIYILFAGWERQDNVYVRVAMGLWIAWPYLLSVAVLVAPAADVNQALSDYKLTMERDLSERLEQLCAQLDVSSITTNERELVEANFDRFTKQRDLLYAMRTWPFRSADSLKYGIAMLGNVVVSLPGLLKFLGVIKFA